MVIKTELARAGGRHLIEVQFVGISGQICSRSYEVDGTETRYFTNRVEAEAALWADTCGEDTDVRSANVQ